MYCPLTRALLFIVLYEIYLMSKVETYQLVHKLMDDVITFEVFPNTGISWETGEGTCEWDDVVITPKQRSGLPTGPNGAWEECDVCESDRANARTIYRRLLADGYLPMR